MYVRVGLQPSVLLRVSQAVLHLLALAALLWVDLVDSLRVILALVVLTSFLRHLMGWMTDKRQPRAIVFIDGKPHLLFPGRIIDVDLQEHVYCTTFLQVLHFKRCQLPGSSADEQQAHYRIVILPDSSSANDRRRLRTMLRWQILAVPAQTDESDHQTGIV